jgi:hypothetical protein
VWFRTRIGLACVEGTAEYGPNRFTGADGRKSIGIYAWQTGPEIRIIYLVCTPDDMSADAVVSEGMQRIEHALCNGETICDLSDLGQDADWGNRVFVRWW